MPVITYEGGKMSTDQKKELIEKMTAICVDVTEIPQEFFSVLIRELSDENLGVGGEQVSDIKKRRVAASSSQQST